MDGLSIGGEKIQFGKEKIDIEKNKAEFIKILKYVERKGMKKLIEFLENTDFFYAPASANNHLSVEGGLCQHSLNVYRALCDINYGLDYYIPTESMVIGCLLHDVCKINTYVKDFGIDFNGNRIYVKKHNYNVLPHSELSLDILKDFIKLTEEEQLAIRYHMGDYDCLSSSKIEMYNARIKYPFVYLLHVADMVACLYKES